MEESRANLYCHREAAAWAPKPRELPVTLVTGFLGAGKTSLLRHILSNKSNLRVAAAVNDFAAVNLDAQLVARSRGSEDAQVVELSNGCVCCSSAAAAGFSEAVAQVLQECDVGKVQYLVVETSGVADPAGLIATLDQVRRRNRAPLPTLPQHPTPRTAVAGVRAAVPRPVGLGRHCRRRREREPRRLPHRSCRVL